MSEPRRVGRYLLLEPLGQGGMGVVHRALDPELDRQVALKLVREDRLGDRERARLLREAQTIARLAHPNVVAVFDVGRLGDDLYVAMELVDGVTLGAWLAAAPRSRADILATLAQAGRGLAAAHAAGLVHRDFKPANVLVGRDGRVRVVDFGIARQTEGRAPPAGVDLTADGAAVGTPSYMSPEQHRGEPADARSDQFSYGLTLYEALYGERPFAVDSDGDLSPADAVAVATIKGELRPPPPGARVPAWLRRVVVRALAPEPADRFPSMAELLDALGRDPAVRWRRAGVAAAFVGLAGALAVSALRPGAPPACPGAESQVAAVWNDGRRQALRAAFVATELLYAAPAAERVINLLDGRAARWTALHRDACEATRVRHEQSEALLDQRMTCLAAGLGELGGFVELATAADPAFVARATDTVARLGDLEACADTRGLAGLKPLPADPVRRGRVAVLSAALGGVSALYLAGQHRRAFEQLLPLITEAQALAYRPLEGRALRVLGQAARMIDDLPLCEELLELALLAAEAGGDDRTRASVESGLALVVGGALSRRAEGFLWARRAAATIERLGGDDRLEATRLASLIQLEIDDGRLDAAVIHARRQVALVEGRGPGGSERLADALFDLGDALRQVGALEEAMTSIDRALAMERRLRGEDHPDLINSYRQRGVILESLGRYPEALAAYEQAAALARRVTGPESRFTMLALSGLGRGYMAAGRFVEAERAFRESNVLRARILGSSHATFASMLGLLANSLYYQGRLAEALEALDRAAKIFEDQHDQANPELGVVASNAGDVLRGLGRPREALARYERALAIWRPLGPDHRYVAAALTGMARAYVDLGETGRALPLLERALARRLGPPESPQLADTQYALALALAQRDPARAGELGRAAFARYRDAGPVAARDAAEVAAWLARQVRPELARRGP